MGVRVLPNRDHRAAHDARAGDAVEQPEHDDDLRHAGADHGDDGDEQQQVRENHPGVHEALDEHVGAATEIARGHAEHDGHQGGQGRRASADDHRQLGADQNPGEHVAAQVIGAEQVLRRRRQQPHRHVGLVQPVGRDQFGEQAAHQEEQEHCAAECAQGLFMNQPPGEALRRRAGRRGANRRQRGLAHWWRTLGSSQP